MNRRAYLIFTFVGLVALTFIGRVFYLQVIDDNLKLSAENNVIRRVKDYAPRGHIYDRENRLIVGNQPAFDLMVIPNQLAPFDTIAFCEIFQIQPRDLKRKLKAAFDYSRLKPSVIIKQIMHDEYARVHEQLIFYPGFFFQRRLLRSYMYTGAANMAGFIGEVSETFVRDNPQYSKGDFYGVAGIERSYEHILRGKDGVRRIVVDVHNREKGRFKDGMYDTLPDPGKHITTTLDIELQMYAEQLMANKRGGIVAIDPKTGELLLVVSSPTYDPTLMVGRDRTRNYSRLFSDSINKPLFDRALLAEYPPGSPFKTVNALIGLQEGAITAHSHYSCNGGFRFGRLFVRCKCGTAGPIPLKKGIYKSCNNYFCNTYKNIIERYPTAPIGLQKWNEYVHSFGMGEFFNNDLPTGRKGLVPDSTYYNRVYRTNRWKAVSTVSNGIGQGELLVTPLQLANLSAIIANRGYYLTPHIVSAIDGEDINDPHFTVPKYTMVDSIHFETVIEGMYQVFEQGTARFSKIEGIEMCGKTGTAENPHGQDHSIFMAFAPKDNPEIAIAVFIENGYWGSRWAAPIASLIMEKYLTGEVERKHIERRMLEGSLVEEYAKQEAILAEKKRQQAEEKRKAAAQ
ncbi:MAG: penicillin-binding protein 2 [Cryomorphaceae bacterium]|nr:penicillin-binding protein 2 [Cryomorphaceae bacterium]